MTPLLWWPTLLSCFFLLAFLFVFFFVVHTFFALDWAMTETEAVVMMIVGFAAAAALLTWIVTRFAP